MMMFNENLLKQQKSARLLGFTLIELLIALTVFLIGILGIWKLYLTSIHANKFASEIVEATMLASDIIESGKYINQASGSEIVNNHFVRKWNTVQLSSVNKVSVNVGWGGNLNECSQDITKCKHEVSLNAVVAN